MSKPPGHPETVSQSYFERVTELTFHSKLDRFKKMKSVSVVHARDNPLIFAFWTCLQLER